MGVCRDVLFLVDGSVDAVNTAKQPFTLFGRATCNTPEVTMRPNICTTTSCAGLFTIVLGAVGCSSGSPEARSDIHVNSASNATSTSGTSTTGATLPGPAEPTTTIPDSPLAIGPGEEEEKPVDCASTNTPTALTKVALAFVFDDSASMGSGQRPQDSKELKWDPVVAATKEFFVDPSSEGISAMLTFFPNELAPLTGDGGFATGGPSCDSANYADTDVPLTPLPSDAFGLAIDAVTPPDGDSWRLGTPTLPAIEGTIQAIANLSAADPNTRFAIVLVTDGIPALCFSGAEDSVPDVAAAVQTVAADTPTYVIGVESPEEASLDQLNQVAYAGGTGTAFLVDTADPAQTKDDFKAAIETIRESTFSCSTPIPPPPGGEMFDKDKVNVTFTTVTGVETPYTYDPTCSSPTSWYYDNPDSPSAIEVCPAGCDSIKATVDDGQLDIEFGCKTRIK